MDTYLIEKKIEEINHVAERVKLSSIHIMEICGSHTHAIGKLGLRTVLSKKIKLVSGPGCPVCVTAERYIEHAMELAERGVVILTFGDLMRLKGEKENLLHKKAEGREIRVIYDLWDSIKLAQENKEKEFVFLAVGFETTAPLIAVAIKAAEQLKLRNLSFLTSIKLMPPVIERVLGEKEKNIQGMLCPGHVAAVEGAEYFRFIYDRYNIPAAICGFDTVQIIGGIYFLLKAIKYKSEKKEGIYFENLYRSTVNRYGNEIAKKTMEEVFVIKDGAWRGIGAVKDSELEIRETYSNYDAAHKFQLDKSLRVAKQEGNRCGAVLLGAISPGECRLFAKECTPRNPCGPGMISQEGSCAAFYKYTNTMNGDHY